jgi:hypothetical protein
LFFFEIGDICDYGHSLEGFAEYVADLSEEAWKTKVMFGIGKGDSFCCQNAFVPVVIGHEIPRLTHPDGHFIRLSTFIFNM